MKIPVLLALLVAAVLLIPASGQTTGNAENGKRLFVKDGCYECHGYAGQGGVAGARIAAISLNAQGLIRYVRAPAGQMPAYKDKVISDQELTDIWAFLQSLPKAKAAKDIPLLNQLK
jgi:mono/diheme cytochrome c family protein